MGNLQLFIDGVLEEIVNPVIALIALAAFLYFVWGVAEFIRAGAGDAEKRSDGQRHMVWGLIGLAIIFSARAIIAIIARTVGA